MSLEQLIETFVAAHNEHDKYLDGSSGKVYWDSELALAANTRLGNAETALLDFVLRHADELISWERAHAARTSFDDYEIGT